ncbi:glucohydrolase [Bacillus cereus]|nr:glucohydrolase [Bacillus cereus]PGU68999.1 glucohydrolase [Bacillus cereus]
MPSFCDGNDDGIGDFQGIISKLDYLKELGVDGIWLTPFYKSPKIDNGYDISNYYEIDSIYGTMSDFESFIQEVHKRDMKVIVDLVLNHTSSEHQWFQESKSSKDNPKRDWYIWKESTSNTPPNNWESFFGGSAWEYDETTREYYYHAFAKEQVDLNWTNPEVKEEMLKVMKFWLEKGIDGFRLDVINFLKVSNNWRNNPLDRNEEQEHLYDKDQEGVLDIIREISEYVHGYGDTFLVGEVGSEDLDILKRYCGNENLDVVFNFNIGSIQNFDVEKIYEQLKNMEEKYKQDQLPTLFFSSHDMSRFYSRFGEEGWEEDRAKLCATLILTGKGVPFIYYGDEIGMSDLCQSNIEEIKDIQGINAYELALHLGKTKDEAIMMAHEKNRDKSRTPMQWDASLYGGFSKVEPWISLSENVSNSNVEYQLNDQHSILSYYSMLLSLRKKEKALCQGDYEVLNKQGNLIYYIKSYKDERILVLLNFNKKKTLFSIDIDLISNYKFLFSNKRSDLKNGKDIMLFPHEAMMLKL